ncbi:hypothetical protein D9615_007330 [Tricholomella constricta]|uniref:Protein kinase domain-containing protein n=1 Tax=Tricholomella constricta TaxID=117010 RepID=A0A8H5H579_9AGAR|nr:hypothetical protein D9615_007330 [Tricholomella constricta]
MASLQHKNILPFFGVVDNPTDLGIVSPFMRNGSLPSYLARNPSANRRNLLIDIAQGLVYLKSCGVIHGDLKGPNILVNDEGVACIADFGLAFYDGDTFPLDESPDSLASSLSGAGTVRYMSPERLHPETNSALSTFASDVFSFGMVIYEAFTNQVPFHAWKHDGRVMLGIVEGLRPERDARIPDDIWSIAQDCWKPNPSDRPLVNEVLDRLLARTCIEAERKM